MKRKTNEITPPKAPVIPDDTLQKIAYFKNRYLGGVIKAVYAQFRDARTTIENELSLAIENHKHDQIDALLASSNIPMVPYHATLADFQAACLNQRDLSLFQQLITLQFIFSDTPNLTLLGPQHFGCEALASGFGDALCRSFLHTYYIHFEHLLPVLILHRIDPKKNKQYQVLVNEGRQYRHSFLWLWGNTVCRCYERISH